MANVTALASRRRRPTPADVAQDMPEPPRSQTTADGGMTSPGLAELVAYQVDLWQRWLLFADTLRQRAEIAVAHERAGMPPVLDFESEMILDARRFDPPANYALLRVTKVGDTCLEDCLDPEKPPVIVVDPRAGHGPGIGGFKQDSEVGVAMHKGHPVYFVVFFPEPCPGQTLADVLFALRWFVERVAEDHGGRPPILYGNCQAGWAIMLLASHCGGLTGPAVLNGSPLSYWAGGPGINPMRTGGGLVGGTWLARFLSDLGDGRFDGAWLVQNFENLNPGHAYWTKYTDLFTRVDSERERFLDFERWWNGYYSLGREEIVQIVRDLFVGNRLEEGKVRADAHCEVDLRAIRNPVVIFASEGDNITPPHQALGWVPIVYPTTQALKDAGQRIVYLINPHVGHLGIFVSAGVARLEHRAILDHLPAIQDLAPGLYEMTIENPTGDPDCAAEAYHVRFEERDVSVLERPYPREEFENVRQISELNDLLYAAFVAPLVRSLVTPWSAETVRQLHPLRLQRWPMAAWGGPIPRGLSELARELSAARKPLPDENPFIVAERQAFGNVATMFEADRRIRDAWLEHGFAMLFGAPGLRRRSLNCPVSGIPKKGGDHDALGP